MKKIIALSATVVLLYSCATTGTQNSSNAKKVYTTKANIVERLKELERKVEENRINVRNNSIMLDRLDARLLVIQRRLEKEAKYGSFESFIPPASKVLKDDKNNSENANNQKTAAAQNIFNTKKQPSSPYDGIVNIFDAKQPKKKKRVFQAKRTAQTSIDKELYNAALQLYNNNDFKGAKKLFEGFINNHGDSGYVDNAMFWLAYSYLHLNEVKKGVDMLKELVKKYPNNSVQLGGKTDAALYALYRLYRNNPSMKEKYKDMLMKRFPKSKYVKLVKK